jgi:hypothetical protein
MNKQQTSGCMGCRSIAVSDTNNYQFPSSLIQSHIIFHPFVPIISNRNYKLLLKFWSWIKNYISVEYYRLDKFIYVVNIAVVDTLIQWYDIICYLLITAMFYQFGDLLGEHHTLGFPSCCNFSTFIEPLNTFVPRFLDDSTYRKLSSDPKHVVQWFWTVDCHYSPLIETLV